MQTTFRRGEANRLAKVTTKVHLSQYNIPLPSCFTRCARPQQWWHPQVFNLSWPRAPFTNYLDQHCPLKFDTKTEWVYIWELGESKWFDCWCEKQQVWNQWLNAKELTIAVTRPNREFSQFFKTPWRKCTLVLNLRRSVTALILIYFHLYDSAYSKLNYWVRHLSI